MRPEVVLHRLPAGDEPAPGTLRRVVVGDRALCLTRTADGGLFAIDDTCTHEEETLSEGELIGWQVECPWHFGRFDVTTGEAVALPATDPVGTYAISREGAELVVEVPEAAAAAAPDAPDAGAPGAS
ncbi:Rieske 2Fe-2S domain-containing protein [Pseudonocardia sichuanensis]